MGLLKTVFEVNLQLFGQKGQAKTKLLFVIRDFIGATSLENLSTTIQKDLQSIWAGLSKPQGLEHSVLAEFFDISFVALPHKILKPSEFQDGLVAISARL